MSDKQMKQVKEQLPTGARVLRAYKAFEGDIRVIVRLPGEKSETRYTVKFDRETDYPNIELMP